MMKSKLTHKDNISDIMNIRLMKCRSGRRLMSYGYNGQSYDSELKEIIDNILSGRLLFNAP